MSLNVSLSLPIISNFSALHHRHGCDVTKSKIPPNKLKPKKPNTIIKIHLITQHSLAVRLMELMLVLGLDIHRFMPRIPILNFQLFGNR